MNKHV